MRLPSRVPSAALPSPELCRCARARASRRTSARFCCARQGAHRVRACCTRAAACAG
jgi:hypothetical protein